MIDNSFRKWLDSYSRFICIPYRCLGLSPNSVTVLAFVVSIGAAACVAFNHKLWAIMLWWISRYFDGTDGIYARQSNQTSLFGAYLDIVLDMASYSLMVIGLAIANPDISVLWEIILFLYVLCIASALALGGLERDAKLVHSDNRGLRLASGLAEGGETGIFYTAVLIFPEITKVASVTWIAILMTTVVARSVVAFRELKI